MRVILSFLLWLPVVLAAQSLNFPAIRAGVDFSDTLRVWDGFGINYVQTAHTYDPVAEPQEYGGFSLLSEAEREKVLELTFGAGGLKVGLLKMFLDPNHRSGPNAPYDHEITTDWMRFFAKRGLEISQADGRDLQIITTLYGPPGWMTLQGENRGRDLDPAHKEDLVDYLASWVRYLVEEAELPLRYVSLHNEGEGWLRWDTDGDNDGVHAGHDYNLFWDHAQILEVIPRLRDRLDANGLSEVSITPGETYSWDRFANWGYAHALASDSAALEHLGLVTSHGFLNWGYGRWNSEHKSAGLDELRANKPGLHAWTTSSSWGKMDANFVRQIYGNIYNVKVNGYIPWAGIQRPPLWPGGDPNAGAAFHVTEEGELKVLSGYYYYKQVTTAGQPGRFVCRTFAMDSELTLIGFADVTPAGRHAFVLTNNDDSERSVEIDLLGTSGDTWRAYRTSEGESNGEVERYRDLGVQRAVAGRITYSAPAMSVTTFYGE